MSFSVVQNTTLGWGASSVWRSARRNSIPLITGMFQSSRITSGIAASQRRERLAPVLGLVDREIQGFEDVAGDLADHLAIIDD